MAARCCHGVALLVMAMWALFCDAQQNAMPRAQGSYYYQDARVQRPRPANVIQQGYYYQDANQQQGPLLDVNQQGYYQDAQNQQLMQKSRRVMGQGYYYQEASQQRGLEAKQQSLSAGCLLQIQSPSKNITICMQADRICTPSVSVPACSSSATSCKPIGANNALINNFISLHPEVYADECTDTSGALCFFTDVKYHSTCSTANTAGRTTFCVMLSDGTERCSNLVDLISAVKTAAPRKEASIVIQPFKPAA